MDTLIKSIVSVIALITGVFALGKGAIDLLKEYRENQSSISELFSNRRFRIAFAIMAVGILVLVGTLWWSTSRRNFVLTIQIWDIELDKKHSVLASKRFSGSAAGNGMDEIFQQAGTWVTEQVKQRYNLSLNEINVDIHVPADLNKENVDIRTDNGDIRTDSESPVQLYYWYLEEANKIRVPLIKEQELKNLGKDFYLEVAYPGYRSETIDVAWGQELNQRITLRQQPVAIGIEEFTGDDMNVSTWLTDYLSANPRLLIKDPKTLAELQTELEKGDAGMFNPAQASIRSSLGLDLIISGNLEWEQ